MVTLESLMVLNVEFQMEGRVMFGKKRSHLEDWEEGVSFVYQ
jgi:hypothetical protein